MLIKERKFAASCNQQSAIRNSHSAMSSPALVPSQREREKSASAETVYAAQQPIRLSGSAFPNALT
jgi:hypothetical protein